MVQQGQFLERPVIIPTADPEQCLEGLYHRGTKTPVVLAPPHPMMGGSMEVTVLNELAYACFKQDFPSMRFNFRGVGASAGSVSADFGDAVEDMGYALEQLLESADQPRAIMGGYSFGSIAAARLALENARARAALLVAPPAARMDCAFMAKLEVETLVVAGQMDQFGPPEKLQELFGECDNVTIEVVPKADHFFQSGLADLGRIVREWLETF